MYGAATDTRFANDFSEVTAWAREIANEPRTIREANFYENRLLELRTRNSAAYKGVHALLMRNDGCRDFRTGDTIEFQRFFDDDIDIHHIFPKAWCERQDINSHDYNSIINKTAIAKRTNLMIGGRAPSAYLERIREDIEEPLPLLIQQGTELNFTNINEILASHLICPHSLRNDNFWEFFNDP